MSRRETEVSEIVINIHPYTERDGIRTISDTVMRSIYERLDKEGLVRWAYFDGSIQSADQFLAAMKTGENRLFVVLHEDKAKAIFWLTHLEGRSCRLHFAIFKEAWGKVGREMGRAVLAFLTGAQDQVGNFIFDSVIGIIPRPNALAKRYASDVGMKRVGTIPLMLFDAYAGKSVDAVVFNTVRGREAT